MKKSFILYMMGLIAMACSEVEPIEVVQPERPIDTEALKAQKSDPENRQISVGAIYGWGSDEKSNLMHTPDDLDMIIVKDDFVNLSDQQKADLKSVREKKATKVLININLNTPFQELEATATPKLAEKVKAKEKEETEKFELQLEEQWKVEKQKLAEKYPTWDEWSFYYAEMDFKMRRREEFESKLKDELKTFYGTELEKIFEEGRSKNYDIRTSDSEIQKLQNNGFDGLCVELPDNKFYDTKFLADYLSAITAVAGKGKNLIFVIENPLTELAEAVNNAQWIIHRQREKGAALLSDFQETASQWPDARFLPSVDFAREDLNDGFYDAAVFSTSGKLPMPLEISAWKSPNKGGAAFYHIEKNYTDITGTVTYMMLRKVIYTLKK